MPALDPIDVTDRRFKADPYPFYARLRDGAGVARVTVPLHGEAWLVARYADVSAALRDSRLVKDPANALTPEQLGRRRTVPAMFAPLMRNMLSLDDPDHARLKRLVQTAFTPRRVEQLVARTETVAEALLDRAERRKRFDLIDDYAMPLPVTVISELLGVPARDRDRFARWSRILIRNAAVPWRMMLSLPQIVAFMRYLRHLVALKRRAPEDDLVSALVAIETEGDKLSGDELLAMITILLTAGHETTTNLIGNGMLALIENRDQRDRLVAAPEMIGSAVEELLRFAGPVETATERYASETIEIAGTTIPKGALVLGAIASANRDEAKFSGADRLDLARDPNRHLTFGEGGHYCVGAALARMEGRVAIPALIRRFPDLRLAEPAEGLRWRAGMVLRGLERLPVEREALR